MSVAREVPRSRVMIAEIVILREFDTRVMIAEEKVAGDRRTRHSTYCRLCFNTFAWMFWTREKHTDFLFIQLLSFLSRRWTSPVTDRRKTCTELLLVDVTIYIGVIFGCLRPRKYRNFQILSCQVIKTLSDQVIFPGKLWRFIRDLHKRVVNIIFSICSCLCSFSKLP